MSDVALFATGSIVFIFSTWATLMFLYWRFNEIYRTDHDAITDGPGISSESAQEQTSTPDGARS